MTALYIVGKASPRAASVVVVSIRLYEAKKKRLTRVPLSVSRQRKRQRTRVA